LFGCDVRVERKVCRDGNARQTQRQAQANRGRGSYVSPRPTRDQGRSYGTLDLPETPLRSLGYQTGEGRASGTPPTGSSNTAWNSYGGRDWSSPVNYTTSPYVGQPDSAGYQAATPQMHTPYASQSVTPYGLYTSQYAWMSPYLADPNLAPMAIAHAYNNLSTGYAQDTEEHEQLDTPTRNTGSGRDRGTQQDDET
jgi:hypothetical protein